MDKGAVKKLYDLIDSQHPERILEEIAVIVSLLDSEKTLTSFQVISQDIIRLFNGDYTGYRASNTKYHDLEHTLMVTLATARLIHGCVVAGKSFEPENILTGLLAALFHDAGLIQTRQDKKGTGAKYTIGHEKRSVAFMRKNLDKNGFSIQQMDDCEQMIKCTNLKIHISDIDFRNEEIKSLGKIVGSADLLAQMSDRHYLEKLLLLFKEFEEAGIPGFESEEELLEKTEGFYKNVACDRLIHQMGNVSSCMKHHFKARWHINRDLYAEAITNNIKYLTSMLSRGKANALFYRKQLKRRVNT
ncbi:MAG: hypothetical protein C4518_08055 [Desulfobacteraceae bacterium]|nr:MAG: hypothetical protein C4518_08055 [Desulfobacteraceae bacterium]